METQDLFDNNVKKITGYSIHNANVKKRILHNTLAELYPSLPDKKYDVIYADSLWDYGGLDDNVE